MLFVNKVKNGVLVWILVVGFVVYDLKKRAKGRGPRADTHPMQVITVRLFLRGLFFL